MINRSNRENVEISTVKSINSSTHELIEIEKDPYIKEKVQKVFESVDVSALNYPILLK